MIHLWNKGLTYRSLSDSPTHILHLPYLKIPFSDSWVGGIIAEVLKLLDLSVLLDIETSGPTLIEVLLVQMSKKGLESLECF